MIDDRYSLSHIYNEDEFRKVLKKFPGYVKALKEIETFIESKRGMEKARDEDSTNSGPGEK